MRRTITTLLATLITLFICQGAGAALMDWGGGVQSTGTRDEALENPRFDAGMQALVRKDYTAAAQAFTDARSALPNSPHPLLGLADVALSTGKTERARTLIEEAVRMAPADATVWIAQGRFRHGQRDFIGAEQSFKKAIELQPKNWRAHIDLADLSMSNLGKVDQAIEAYEAALKIEPKHPGTLYGYGVALLAKRAFPSAIEALGAARERAPGNILVALALARAQLGNGDLQPALAGFDAILSQSPNLAGGLIGRADTLLALGRSKEAITAYRTAAERIEDNWGIWLQLGQLYQADNQLDQATAAYEKVIAGNPEHPIAYNNLAWMHASSGTRMDEALRWAKKANALNPDSPGLLDTLGYVHLKRGEADAAVDVLDKAAAMAPKQPDIELHLAQALNQAGQTERAARVVDAILAEDPTHREALALRRSLEAAGR